MAMADPTANLADLSPWAGLTTRTVPTLPDPSAPTVDPTAVDPLTALQRQQQQAGDLQYQSMGAARQSQEPSALAPTEPDPRDVQAQAFARQLQIYQARMAVLHHALGLMGAHSALLHLTREPEAQ